MLNRVVYVVVFLLLISVGLSEVLFEQDFSKSISDDTAKAQVRDGSLDYKFHRETGNRLWIQDYDAGIAYPLDNSVINPSVHPTVYLSFCLRSLNSKNNEKFAGVVLYQNDKELFGLGNDWASENFSFWAPDGKGIAIGDIPTVVDSDVHKIVMRIDYRPNGLETIKVGLDPFCRRSEDRQPDHIWSWYECELNFDKIRIRCGNEACQWEFDELRIGTDWASVTAVDDGPGEHIDTMTANASQPGSAEMIHEGVARFWPTGVIHSKVLPSFVLEKPIVSTGSVANSWKIKPQFGMVDNLKYAYIDLPAEVDLYGTGEVTGSLLRNGTRIILFNKDNYGYGKPDQLYQSHPWVLGVRSDGSAFGVIFDTPWRAELNLRSGILFTVDKDAPDFPVMVIEAESPQQVMIKLAKLTGTIPMPPRWALGYQQCRYSYHPDAHARHIADTFRAKQIPCDVIWFDIDYMNGFRIFTFDSIQYPDPKDTNDYMHARGFKTVWMIDPGVKYEPGYFVYDSGAERDVWVKTASGEVFIGPVWPGNCVFPDFTIPAVRTWWGGLYTKFMAKGIDGIWNDMNEPAVFNSKTNWTMPLDNHHRGGGDLPPGSHEQYHNVYGMLMVKASREGIQKANPAKRPFVLSRANFLGGHRYAATWTGDNKATWQHLKWSIPMSLNLSLSGQPFNGPDIGGFAGNATPQLWAHWISVGAFYPFSRAHTSTDTANQEPWAFGPETEKAAQIALQRRYRLMPYLYTLFHQSHEIGLPVMCPILFADPADESLRMEDQAFLLGEDVMVVPKWAENVQLPKGIWRSVSIVGDDTQNDPYQCDVKIRGGAIVPLGPVVQTTQEIQLQQPLLLVVVPDDQGKAEGALYEDTGDGYDYLKGQFCISTFTASKDGNSVIVKCVQQQGDLACESRLVSVMVIDDQGIHHGYGDICSNSGVRVSLGTLDEWNNRDIGKVGAAGSVSKRDGTFIVAGSGTDIEGQADEFQFVYKQLNGDCEVIARIVSQHNTNGWAKAGVMIRQTLEPGSQQAMTVMTPGNGAAFQRRIMTKGSTTSDAAESVKSPHWVRLIRAENTFTGYHSEDGTDWKPIGSATIRMDDTVYVGLAVTSHENGLLCTATFDNVSISSKPASTVSVDDEDVKTAQNLLEKQGFIKERTSVTLRK